MDELCVASLSVLLSFVALGIAVAARRRVQRLEADVTLLRRLARPVPPGPSTQAPSSAALTESPAPSVVAPPADGTEPTPPPAVAAPAAPPDSPELVPPLIAFAERPVSPDLLAALDVPRDAAPAPSPAATDAAAPVTESPAAPPPRRRDAGAIGIEEQLGARLPIWIGAIAFFLAGAFFVKYTFDAGLISPGVRIILGALFGLALIAAGEWTMRRALRISLGLTAAGVADLFAVALAATNLYHFLPPAAGFVLLACITAATIGLSLRHGPFVALLGLIGGYATPALIGSAEPHPGPLFSYLFLLQAGLLVAARRRAWWPLTALTLLGSLAWALLSLVPGAGVANGPWVGTFLLATIACFVAGTYPTQNMSPVHRTAALRLSVAGAIVGIVVLAVTVNAAGFTPLDWAFLALLGAGALALAAIDPRYLPLPAVAAAAAMALLIAWWVRGGSLDHFGVVAAGLGLLFSGGAYAALYRGRRPAAWAVLSVCAALGFFLTAHTAMTSIPRDSAWALGSLVIAAAYATAAVPILRRRCTLTGAEAVLAALLTGATSFLSLAAPIALDRSWIPVAWALEVPALAWLNGWLRVERLRTLARLLAGLAVAWLVHPAALDDPVHGYLVLNSLLFTHALPAVALAVAAWLMARSGDPRTPPWLEGGAASLVFVLATLNVRHAFHPGAPSVGDFSLIEWAFYTNVWLALALAALFLESRCAHAALRLTARIGAAVAALAALVTAGVLFNPLWCAESVGATPLFNWLLIIYLLPAVLAWIAAHAFAARREQSAARLAETFGLLFAAVWATFQVRHGFHGELFQLAEGAPGLKEWAVYVLVWGSLGIAALLAQCRWPRASLLHATRALCSLAGAAAVLALVLTHNPLFRHEHVGTWAVVNHVLWIYGLPTALALAAARLFARQPQPRAAVASGGIGLLLLLLLITLEVRQGFQGPYLDAGTLTSAESYAYSAAWVALGTALVCAGVATRSLMMRWASLAVMTLAIGKVFLIDTANLRDLYRVLSLFGLGLSLMLLAVLYQRFVFRARRSRNPPQASG